MHSCNHQSRTKLKFWFSRSSWDGPSRPRTSPATAIVLAFTLLATLNLYDSFKLQGLYMNLRGCILALCDLVSKPYVHEITGYCALVLFIFPQHCLWDSSELLCVNLSVYFCASTMPHHVNVLSCIYSHDSRRSWVVLGLRPWFFWVDAKLALLHYMTVLWKEGN